LKLQKKRFEKIAATGIFQEFQIFSGVFRNFQEFLEFSGVFRNFQEF
jgi:hypothetical protein